MFGGFMRTRVLTLLAAATAAVAAPQAASAATVIGSFSAALIGVGSSTSTIGADTTFSNVTTIVSSASGGFSGIPAGFSISLDPVTATVGSAINFGSMFGGFTGAVNSVTLSANVVSFYALGTFSPSFGGYDAGDASVTFSFTQTGGADSAVSGSFSLASPPSGVPEPATWGMMIAGAGMAGAAVRRRRSSAKVAAA